MKNLNYQYDAFRTIGESYGLKHFVTRQELRFLYYCRKIDEKGPITPLWRFLRKRISNRTGLEIETKNIGPGLLLVHPFGITVNPNCKVGKNVNLHKGVTLGAENRGEQAGVPTLGDCVWVGVNSTVVGKVTIGNNVMIAPNTFVNFDVPSNSIVIGNPAKIISNIKATDAYINRKV